jgi:hypothetical protein
MPEMSRSIQTPRADGATLAASFTVSKEVPEGTRCLACNAHVGPGQYHECWNETDLVSRLRTDARHHARIQNYVNSGHCAEVLPEQLVQWEAADRIEALEAALEKR